MPEMRKCKECGKLFMPKGREQYCPDIHYRPCPICGTPVEAKYLSDPPRKCDKCRGRKTIQPKPAKKMSRLFKIDDPKFKDTEKSKFDTPKDNFKFSPPKKEEPKETPEVVETIPTKLINQEYKTDDLILERAATIGQQSFCETLTGSVRRYIGPKITRGFIPGHDYLLKVSHGEYTYSVESKEDVTTGEDVDICLEYSSQISINQYFYRLKES